MQRSWLCLLFVVFGACTTPTAGVAAPPSSGTPVPVARKAPAWRFRPLSWAKLEEVQRWLDAEGRFATPEQRVEAELCLAEGRLVFARRDKEVGGPALVRQRLVASQEGFQRILANPSASAADRQKANSGLRSVQELLGAPKARALAASSFLPRSSWRADPALPKRLTRSDGAWSKLTVHHSAEYAGLLRGRSESASAIQSIQGYHMDEKGYGDIAYHFLVDPSGRVFEGRSLDWQGAHAGGTNNIHNIGVCLLGDFEREAPTRAALDALAKLVAELRSVYGIPASRVFGHGELKTTACPGKHLRSWLQRYRSGSSSAGIAAAAR